ncbi:hypothetical protein AWP63_26065 [Escherichia coli]|nr:hypothetical protein AWP63_26065 [Escherichia coli]
MPIGWQLEKHEETPYPLVDDLERFYGHLEQTLLATGFIRENHPGQVMNKRPALMRIIALNPPMVWKDNRYKRHDKKMALKVKYPTK